MPERLIVEPPPLPGQTPEPHENERPIPISREHLREEQGRPPVVVERPHLQREEIDLADLNRNFPRPQEAASPEIPESKPKSNEPEALEGLKHQLSILESAIGMYHERLGKLREQEQEIQTFLDKTQDYLASAETFLAHPESPAEHKLGVLEGATHSRIQLAEHRQKLEAVQKNLGTDDSFRLNLHRQATELQGKIQNHEALKSEAQSAEKPSSAREKTLADIDRQIKEIETGLETRNKRLEELGDNKKQIAELQTYNRDIANGSDNPKQKIEHDLKDVEDQLKAVSAKVRAFTQQNESLKVDESKLTSWDHFLKAFGVGKAEQVEIAQNNAEHELKTLMPQLQELESRRNVLSGQLNTVNERLGQISELGGSEVRLQVEESAVNEQIKALTQRKQALETRRMGIEQNPESLL